jgi:hypothetical protein
VLDCRIANAGQARQFAYAQHGRDGLRRSAEINQRVLSMNLAGTYRVVYYTVYVRQPTENTCRY